MTTTYTSSLQRDTLALSGVGGGHNAANQRDRATLADETYWSYDYDAQGQVIAGRRNCADGTLVAGQQFTYRFDEIGNRTTTGGRASAVSTYTPNRRNQYASRTVAGIVDVLGIANPTAAVTVGIQGQTGTAATRQGQYYHGTVNVANGTAQSPNLEVKAVNGGTPLSKAGRVFVPATPESYQYDLDGNLIQDGRWTYTWDGENRLEKQESLASAPGGSKRRLEFAYDPQGRRIWRKATNLDANTLIAETRYLYDGWNVLAELPLSSATPLRTYVWGTDLSGTTQGAGGVGGLLWVNDLAAGGTHFYCYDGNGNVMALVKASDASVSARYEHGPFGEPIRQTGTFADAQRFRFSTKWTDDDSGLLYYGYRYYNPSTGNWLNRDPLEEFGGVNLSGFVANDPLSRIDRLGLIPPVDTGGWPPIHCPTPPAPADPLSQEAWRMFYYLSDGDLQNDYVLSHSTIEAAKARVNRDLILVELRKAAACNRSGTTVITQDDPYFTIEKNSGPVNLGRWQLHLRSTATWECGKAIIRGGRCCCRCAAKIHVKAFMTKTYTFRAHGYNTDNASWGIRFLNAYAREEQLLRHWCYISGGPAFFVAAQFEFWFSSPFSLCETHLQP